MFWSVTLVKFFIKVNKSSQQCRNAVITMNTMRMKNMKVGYGTKQLNNGLYQAFTVLNIMSPQLTTINLLLSYLLFHTISSACIQQCTQDTWYSFWEDQKHEIETQQCEAIVPVEGEQTTKCLCQLHEICDDICGFGITKQNCTSVMNVIQIRYQDIYKLMQQCGILYI